MFLAKITCEKCRWEGLPTDRVDSSCGDKEFGCPECGCGYFEAPAYSAEIRRLKSMHGFGFLLNSGGGAFISDEHGSCQISTYDAPRDYVAFLAFLKDKGLET